MKRKTVIFSMVYILSWSVNFLEAIQYPDLNMSIENLMVSLVFTVTLFWYFMSPREESKYLNTLLFLGFVCAAIVKPLSSMHLASIESQSMFLDMISNIQYPAYFLFVIPIFGLNFLLNIDYGSFSFLSSLIYGFILVLRIRCQKSLGSKNKV